MCSDAPLSPWLGMRPVMVMMSSTLVCATIIAPFRHSRILHHSFTTWCYERIYKKGIASRITSTPFSHHN